MSFIAAIQFLTVIPVPERLHISKEAVGRSALWFPVVGLVIGVILALAVWLLSYIFTQWVTTVIMLIISAVLTGMLHLDGFTDTCDGIFGHRSVEERLRIMRDSRAGTYGIVGVVLLLLLKFTLLNTIITPYLLLLIVIMTVTGRWSIVYGIFIYSYARSEGAGKAFKEGTGWITFMGATCFTLIIYGAFIPVAGYNIFIVAAAAFLVTALFALLFSRRLSGLTGDTYGALSEISEVTVLISAVILITTGFLI